jgi:hypothetical protein
MIRSVQWKKINDCHRSIPEARVGCMRLLTRGRHDGSHKDRRVAIEQREAHAVGGLCTTDRCSDTFKDRLRPPAFNLNVDQIKR